MSLRVASLASRRRAPRAASRAATLLLVDQFREAPGDRGERLADVAKERHVGGVFASERLRVVGDMQHGDPFGHRLGFAIGIGDEGASADQHDRLRRLQVSAHVGEIGLQHARPAGMVGRKRGARRELSAPDRKAAGLGEGDEASARRRRQVVAEQDDDPIGIEARERLGQPRRVGRRPEPRRRGGRRRRVIHVLIEDVHRQRQKHRPARRRARKTEGAPKRRADVVGAPQLLRPFGHRRSERDEIAGEPRLGHQMPCVLLAGGDDERRLARLGGDQHAHGVAEAAHRMQVDEGGRGRWRAPSRRPCRPRSPPEGRARSECRARRRARP